MGTEHNESLSRNYPTPDSRRNFFEYLTNKLPFLRPTFRDWVPLPEPVNTLTNYNRRVARRGFLVGGTLGALALVNACTNPDPKRVPPSPSPKAQPAPGPALADGSTPADRVVVQASSPDSNPSATPTVVAEVTKSPNSIAQKIMPEDLKMDTQMAPESFFVQDENTLEVARSSKKGFLDVIQFNLRCKETLLRDIGIDVDQLTEQELILDDKGETFQNLQRGELMLALQKAGYNVDPQIIASWLQDSMTMYFVNERNALQKFDAVFLDLDENQLAAKKEAFKQANPGDNSYKSWHSKQERFQVIVANGKVVLVSENCINPLESFLNITQVTPIPSNTAGPTRTTSPTASPTPQRHEQPKPSNTAINTPKPPPSPPPSNTPVINASPTIRPSATPENRPTNAPTFTPTIRPTSTPENRPTNAPTFTPAVPPTETSVANTPTVRPTATPEDRPTSAPTFTPAPPTNTPGTIRATATPG